MNVVKSQCNNTPPPLLLLQRLPAPQPSCNYYCHLTLLTGAFAKLRIATISFVMSVRPSVYLSAWNNSAPTGRIFIKFDIWAFPENLSIKFKFHLNPTRVTVSLDGDVFTYMTISRWILLKIRNVCNKSHWENKNVHFMSNNFFVENRPIYKIMSKNVKLERPQMTIWRRTACWISKATRAQTHTRARAPTPTDARTHTQKYVILIAFQRQQWFRERALLLRLPTLSLSLKTQNILGYVCRI